MHRFSLVTDRGGHLHNAVMLLEQMQLPPNSLVTTYGPDIKAVREFPLLKDAKVLSVPYLFSWWGKRRFFNPLKFVAQAVMSLLQAVRVRPHVVISLGAANVVLYCYWAKLLGATVYHVECMNQVHTKSITGKLLYPICNKLFVQWEELLPEYGPKAQYVGWVL